MERYKWFAVHVKSRHEFPVVERLTAAGIAVFLPAVERLRKWKDRNKLVRFPLFPGYLFVHTDASRQSQLTVLKTKGVVRMLGSVPGEPEPIPEEQIVSLKTVMEACVPVDPYPYLQEGKRVRIIRGPLEGVEGILMQKTDHHYVVLSVDILRQSTAVRIEASDLEEAT
jgi:transcription termination/antitermination protein NusG